MRGLEVSLSTTQGAQQSYRYDRHIFSFHISQYSGQEKIHIYTDKSSTNLKTCHKTRNQQKRGSLQHSMTTPPKPPQPNVIIRQRRQEPRRRRRRRRGPERRRAQVHQPAGEVPVDSVLRRLHGGHGDEAHARRGARGRGPGERVGPAAEEDGFEGQGRCDARGHFCR